MEAKDLTASQRIKLGECKNVDELVELAHAEGVELSDEQLEGVAGGKAPWEKGDNALHCPNCNGTNLRIRSDDDVECNDCGHIFPY